MFAMQHPKEVPQELAQQLLELFGKLGYKTKTVPAAELAKLGIEVPEQFRNAQVGIVTGNPVAQTPAVDTKVVDKVRQEFRELAAQMKQLGNLAEEKANSLV